MMRTLLLLLLSASVATGAAALAGFIFSLVLSYADGPQGSNHFTAIWICGLACVLAAQGVVVTLVPSCSADALGARFRVWCCYGAVVASCGLILLVCLGIALPTQSGWACLWVVSACIIVAAARQHHQHAPAPGASNDDVEQPTSGTVNAIICNTQGSAAEGHAAESTTKGPAPLHSSDSSAGSVRWRQCGVGCGHCIAWSSLFWVAVLGAFLVIQSAYLASDLRVFPPPGVLVSVPITLAGGTATVKLHIHCSGPSTPGLSTFILEAGGGSPGVTMAGLADALAASSRRVCWYDRLGYGWSDGAIKPTTSFRNTEALNGLLAAAPAGLAPPPVILVGHSAGGQLALQYATSYPDQVSGIALLDSYSDVAIALSMLLARSPGGSLPTHQVRAPNGSMVALPDPSVAYGATVPLLDLLRAVTPLAWARWITAGGWGRVRKHGPAAAAMYGSNSEWNAQWVEVLGLASGWTVADNLTLANGQAIWHGAGWPDFSPKPVLLMPAAQTLALPPVCNVGTDPTISSDCVSTVQQPQQYCSSQGASSGFPSVGACLASLVYADLYFAYTSTLSFNSTLFVQPSATHAFVWESPEAVAEQLVAKFDGV